MRAFEPEIRANMLAGLKELLATSFGLDLGQLLAEVGLPADIEPDAGKSISLNAYSRLLELAAARTGDECFGLRFAGAFPRGGMHALGFLILNAPDLRTCLDCLRRYVRLQCDAVDFKFEEGGGIARLVVQTGPAFIAPRKQFLEFVMSLTVTRLGNEFGTGLVPRRAEFSYREPKCRRDYERLFGDGLRFDAAETALTLRSDVLKKKSNSADDKLFGLLKDLVEREIAELHRRQDVVWRLSEYIVSSLAVRTVSLEGAAAAVGRSPRQLQLDLKRQDTTFADEVSRVRRLLAERYLRDSSLPLTEIALLLGFSELSAFTRAARSWFGKPPSEWRQQPSPSRAGSAKPQQKTLGTRKS